MWHLQCDVQSSLYPISQQLLQLHQLRDCHQHCQFNTNSEWHHHFIEHSVSDRVSEWQPNCDSVWLLKCERVRQWYTEYYRLCVTIHVLYCHSLSEPYNLQHCI